MYIYIYIYVYTHYLQLALYDILCSYSVLTARPPPRDGPCAESAPPPSARPGSALICCSMS